MTESTKLTDPNTDNAQPSHADTNSPHPAANKIPTETVSASKRDFAVMSCWQCAGELSVDRSQVGATVQCPHCGSGVHVPGELFGIAPAAAPTSEGGEKPRPGKSPSTAAILNFLFLGAGYAYIGRAWGWILLFFDILLSLGTMGAAAAAPVVWTVVWLPLHIGLAWHAYHMVKESQRPSS